LGQAKLCGVAGATPHVNPSDGILFILIQLHLNMKHTRMLPYGNYCLLCSGRSNYYTRVMRVESDGELVMPRLGDASLGFYTKTQRIGWLLTVELSTAW